MQHILMVVLSLHVLAAVFWAGSTFTLARAAGAGSAALFRPQLIAAAVTAGTGGYLWVTLHEGSFGSMEKLLIGGALAAMLAATVQVLLVGSGLRLARVSGDGSARVRTGQRAAAVLLALATLSMGAARYA